MTTKQRIVWLGLTAIVCLSARTVATTTDIETHKDNNVYRDDQSLVGDYSDVGSGYLQLGIHNGTILYAAFDLSPLPSGAVITGAQIGVFDERTNNSFTVIASLVDVADDWDETTLNWTMAAASYGAATGIEQMGGTQNTNAAMVDFSKVQWQGTLAMTAVPAAQIWSLDRGSDTMYPGTTTYHGGVAWTTADLTNALNLILNGDQTAVFSFTSAYGKSQYISERNATGAGSGPGPTLKLDYEVIQPGDANQDGQVNLSDLQILGDNWQATGVPWANADFTFDGVVNLADLQILGDNWGYGTAADLAFDEAVVLAGLVIPEPASLGLLVAALPWAWRRHG
ncbi:MAG: hypothetical protein IT445_03515 [Phycisphaeraceae bacterium]|nr:hypothetical protein [Phycisphaeraceae bacterium]